MPQTFWDAGIFAAIGLLSGLLVVSVREFARTPIGDFLHKLTLDNESSAYTKTYLEKMLLNMKAADTSWPISFILISLKNSRDVYRILPSFSRKKIMTETFRRLKGQLKGNDLIGRWDEFTFAVVLPMTPKKAVGVIEDRLLQSLQPPISYGVEDSDQVELSPISVISTSENIQDFETFISKAEETLRDEEW